MNEFTKTVLTRFVRGAVTSAVSTMVVVAPVGISTFTDLKPWLLSLALAGIIGVVTGGLQAVDKALRWQE